MSAEEWRPIPGYPDYEASDLGRVRSMKVWRGQPGPRILTTGATNGHGYLILTCVSADGVKRKVTVHKLVALAFQGQRPLGNDIRHLDGDRQNNHASNLLYGTRSENNLDQVTHGTHPWASRTHCARGHEFTTESVVPWRNGARECGKCRRARQAAYRLRKATSAEVIAS